MHVIPRLSMVTCLVTQFSYNTMDSLKLAQVYKRTCSVLKVWTDLRLPHCVFELFSGSWYHKRSCQNLSRRKTKHALSCTRIWYFFIHIHVQTLSEIWRVACSQGMGLSRTFHPKQKCSPLLIWQLDYLGGISGIWCTIFSILNIVERAWRSPPLPSPHFTIITGHDTNDFSILSNQVWKSYENWLGKTQIV